MIPQSTEDIEMTQFEIYDAKTASADAGDTLRAVADMIGFIPNVFGVLGQSPKALEAFASLNQLFGASSLSPVEREIIQTAVSVKNNGAYCVAGHTAFADMQGLDADPIQAVRDQRHVTDKKHEALRRLTERLAESKGHHAQAELFDFLNVGYRPEQVFDVILGITVKMYSNLTSGITNIPLDPPFEPFDWSASTVCKTAA